MINGLGNQQYGQNGLYGGQTGQTGQSGQIAGAEEGLSTTNDMLKMPGNSLGEKVLAYVKNLISSGALGGGAGTNPAASGQYGGLGNSGLGGTQGMGTSGLGSAGMGQNLGNNLNGFLG